MSDEKLMENRIALTPLGQYPFVVSPLDRSCTLHENARSHVSSVGMLEDHPMPVICFGARN